MTSCSQSDSRCTERVGIFFAALHVLFFAPVLLRATGRTARDATEQTSLLAEVATGTRKPALVLHGAGLLLLWTGVVFAFVERRVSRAVTGRGVLGAVLVLCAAVLMAWSVRTLRSWRLLPTIDARHELCTTGPYGLVRHPMYLAIDLLGVGSAAWVGTVPIVLAAAVLVLGGDLRARIEEKALVEAFGDRYRDYMKQVRRTLPLVY